MATVTEDNPTSTSPISTRRHGDVLIILSNNPPVNALGAAVRQGLVAAIEEAGGGLVEAYPEQVEGRPPQRGAYFHTGPEDLFEEFGFERDRRIAKWRWVVRRRVRPAGVGGGG